jgi:RNA polymerase sigma factor (sigma-70 family)
VIAAELLKLRSLVRALVHGDADGDDLLQDAAVAALEHPPDLDRPVRPWLATVIRNRWRMSRRSAARRAAREQWVATALAIDTDEPIERARLLERLTSALVQLDEPFRTVVVRRYLDHESCACAERWTRARRVAAGWSCCRRPPRPEE